VRGAFTQLTARLVNSLGVEQRRKVGLDLRAKAQVAIDILVRNLFERTADIGFLATDGELRRFAGAEPSARVGGQAALLARFRDYQRKYTVYEDIVLASPEGAVLARLGTEPAPAATRDPLVRECLDTHAPYVESYRKFDLMPEQARTLVYAYRVLGEDGRRSVGVLGLCFRFEDECARIFAGLLERDDLFVICLVDRDGHVVATSDAQQLGVGARVPGRRSGAVEVVRCGGRPYLAVSCHTSGYQGYMGPGWSGYAMVPLEFAFDTEGIGDPREALDARTLADVLGSELLFSAALREIPRAAAGIQTDLNRAVWNGSSKTLLGEIGATGVRTRDVFSRALDNLHRTVASAVLRDARGKAALAIDIMDRNLYERANDCRWWALTPAFRTGLEAALTGKLGSGGRTELTDILTTINGLYTVYTNLVLFDAQGRVVAVSNPAYAARVGDVLREAWVGQTLLLASSDDYCVSQFEPSDLYDGRHTYVYCAAVKSARVPGRTVGGIGIVFDSAPQFRAMLAESLPRNEAGEPLGGAFGVFVDAEQRVIGSTRNDIAPGQRFALPEGVALSAAEHGWEAVLALGDALCAVGGCLSTGYREYKGPHDRYRNEVHSLVCIPLSNQRAERAEPRAPAARPPQRVTPASAEPSMALALFAVGESWYALPCDQVVEGLCATKASTVYGLGPYIRGYVVYEEEALTVIDLAALLGIRPELRLPPPAPQVVIVRAGAGRTAFALLVDALGDTPEVPLSRVVPVPDTVAARDGLVERLVRSARDSDDGMIAVLSADALAAALGAGGRGAQRPSAGRSDAAR